MLKIEHLSVAVRGRKILNDINLHIKPGEVHVLFGPNGTGKSTLIGAIMGLNRYEILEGKIYFKGQDITDMSSDERARLGVGVMIQRPPTIRGLSLRKMVEICGATSEEAETMAKWMGLDNFLDRSVNDGFSGGELKRCELLQLMAQNPDLLLLDEPAAGMNPKETEELSDFIRQIHKEYNLTVFMIEHHMDLVMEISDRIYVLEFGMTIAEGTPEEFQNNQRVIDAYLGVDEDA